MAEWYAKSISVCLLFEQSYICKALIENFLLYKSSLS